MKIINLKFVQIILTFFLIFQKCYSDSYEKLAIKDIFVEFSLNDNNSSRKKAVDMAYNIALERYLTWITLKNKTGINNIISRIDPNKVIKGYSIENEKFSKNKYSALITVNFNKTEISKLLNEENIKFSLLKGSKILIIPLLQVEDRYILWDDPNPWFEAWMRRPLDANLTEFILPTGDIEDLITLSAEDAEALIYYKIKNITNKYNAKKTIILFLKIKKNSNEFSYDLKAVDGLNRKEINLKDFFMEKQINFDKTLQSLANSFSNFYDDIWVKNNINELEASKSNLDIEIQFTNLKQWIKIKKILTSNKRVSEFLIYGLSNRRALAYIEVLSRNNFINEIEEENILLSQNKNSWILKFNDN